MNLRAPAAVVGSNDPNARKLLALAHQHGAELRSRFVWPQLAKRHVFTMVADQESYPLPVDYERQIPDTHWTLQNRWKMPLIEATQWQAIKSSLIATVERERIKFEGVLDNQIYIDPTPSASNAGQDLTFYYLSKNWIRPKMWVSGTAYSSNDVVWYNGNVYLVVASGTAGATAPVHTTGTESDGVLDLTYQALSDWDTFRSDLDVPLLDSNLIGLGVQYKYLQSSGYEFAPALKDYEDHLSRVVSDLGGDPVINATKRLSPYYLAYGSVPDGSWSM